MDVKITRILGKLIALSLITSTMLHATNGDNLIAMGAKARGMGGVGIAMSHGAESGLGNAALITSVKGTEIGFGGTLFMPDIETQLGDGTAYASDADTNMIPEVSIAYKINNNWYIGVGMWGTAGMGADYNKAPTGANMNMVTNLQLMQFGVPIAYKTGGLSLAVTPVLQYGNLDINYYHPVAMQSFGAGLAQDFGFGYNLGLAYDFSVNGVAGLTLGAQYKSAIAMDYNPQLTTAITPFLNPGPPAEPLSNLLPDGDELEQPSEYAVGIAYAIAQHTFAFDYKKIKWSDAKAYSDFGWDDSDVYAVGYQYARDKWAVRTGYNRASSAVVEIPGGATNFPSAAINLFNLLGFPATAEEHYTVGGSYAFTDTFSLDLAYVHSPKTSETFSIAALGMGIDTITTSHEEDSLSFQLAYKF